MGRTAIAKAIIKSSKGGSYIAAFLQLQVHHSIFSGRTPGASRPRTADKKIVAFFRGSVKKNKRTGRKNGVFCRWIFFGLSSIFPFAEYI